MITVNVVTVARKIESLLSIIAVVYRVEINTCHHSALHFVEMSVSSHFSPISGVSTLLNVRLLAALHFDANHDKLPGLDKGIFC